jgi:hypothetical protein
LKTPLARILEGDQLHLNNWRTYAMKGEWLRARASLADPAPRPRIRGAQLD